MNQYFEANLKGTIKASDSSSNANQKRLKSIRKDWHEFIK
jgi:hypothetical protein